MLREGQVFVESREKLAEVACSQEHDGALHL